MRIFLLRHGETNWNLQGRCQGVTDLDLIRASYPDFIRMWRSEPAGLLLPGGERLIDVERKGYSLPHHGNSAERIPLLLRRSLRAQPHYL